MKTKVAVLIHGYSILRTNWEEVVWGDPSGDLMGRLPKGALTAIEERAEVLVFGTGSSEKDGKIEAAWMRDTLFERFSQLAEFSAFRGIRLEEFKDRLKEISVLETKSQNTKEEARLVGEILLKKGVNKVIIVSSPDHISRCIRDTYLAYSEDERFQQFNKRLFASPCEVSYSGPVSEVEIKEPCVNSNHS